MKTRYSLASLLVSFKVAANPFVGNYGALHSEVQIIEPAPDPPPAGTPLPFSRDGVMPDGSVINYTPNNPSNRGHSCWTPPQSQPPVSKPIDRGTCSVCVLQRNNNNGSADYEFWARDNKNNAIGNMGEGVTVWPLDGAEFVGANNQSITNMGQTPLRLFTMLGADHHYTMAFLNWEGTEVTFDPSPPVSPQGACVPAGTATAGQVIYFTCFFDC